MWRSPRGAVRRICALVRRLWAGPEITVLPDVRGLEPQGVPESYAREPADATLEGCESHRRVAATWFLMVKDVDAPTELVVVLDWLEELTRVVPTP